ncbi:CBS domain-containing protein [Pseudaminobacter sp. NGMCC 1.201702]|uniref:CBS domain-containing protein n=1 Tax=Pseudaminobacter sp. NGMCC 1.201702 TaxID=3391825 RepID=UPI0039F0DF44
MKAGDIMTVGAVTVRPDATIEHAARMMIEHGISGLPVVDGAGKLVGIVTEGDLLHRPEIGTERRRPRWLEMWTATEELAQDYARQHGRKIEDVMTNDVASIGPDAELDEVADLLERRRIKRLPVVRDGTVVGLISRANLVLALSRRMGDVPAEVVDDLAIRRHILDEIASKLWAPTGTLDVIVHGGVVELNGTVTDAHVRDAVRVAAENSPGVVRVWDRLRVVAIPIGYTRVLSDGWRQGGRHLAADEANVGIDLRSRATTNLA